MEEEKEIITAPNSAMMSEVDLSPVAETSATVASSGSENTVS